MQSFKSINVENLQTFIAIVTLFPAIIFSVLAFLWLLLVFIIAKLFVWNRVALRRSVSEIYNHYTEPFKQMWE